MIDHIHNHRHLIDEVSMLMWMEWENDYIAFTNFKNPQDIACFLGNVVSTNTTPLCYVMLNEHKDLIGFVIVDNEDMMVHPEVQPWLSTLYILPRYRRQGHATVLIDYLIAHHKTLYLWTWKHLVTFYEKHGFVLLEVIPKHGHHENICFMCCNQPSLI